MFSAFWIGLAKVGMVGEILKDVLMFIMVIVIIIQMFQLAYYTLNYQYLKVVHIQMHIKKEKEVILILPDGLKDFKLSSLQFTGTIFVLTYKPILPTL